jgi:hypothetical protein
MIVATHPPFFLFPQSKIKLKDRHIDAIEVIKAESQVLLNTITEQASTMHLKKWQKR